MDELFVIGAVIGLIIPLFFAICGYNTALKKNRGGCLWFFICLMTGVFGLIILACSKILEHDEELDFNESDTLGYWMLGLALIWFGLTFWYGFESARRFHDQLVWNALLQFM